MSTKFIHIRNIDTTGAISPRGGWTYAYREANGTVEYAVAQCSSLDNFRKAYGRAKAAGRLHSPTLSRVFEGNADQFRNAVYDNRI